MTYTINICPECGAQEQPSPFPDEFAETVHTEKCRSGPDNVTVEVVPRTVADAVVDAIAAELPLLREARGGRQTAVDEPLAKYREAVERPDDDTYGQYNADGTPKRALRRVLDEMENDA